MKTLRMKKDYHIRLLKGHLWGWKNDFDPHELSQTEPGEVVRAESSRGEFIGTGFVNPNSHVAFRLLRRQEGTPDDAFFRGRLENALDWRRRIRPDNPVCRLVYGESDGLPGLTVDRYGPVLVLSQSVYGMEQWTPFFIQELHRRLNPEIIILKNSNPLRRLEGLPLETSVVKGAWQSAVEVNYDGVRVLVDCFGGRKTGLFLDHRENRLLLKHMLQQGDTVLDLYSHCGLWSLTLMDGGASRSVCVENDQSVIDLGRASVEANGWTDRIEFIREDVALFLQSSSEIFDIVVLDPPAFAKKKRYLKNALPAYEAHNELALRRIRPGGLFVSSSCSSFVSREILEKVIRTAAIHAGRRLQLVAQGTQALDHPVLFAMPETHYLKCLFFRVMD